ncbi:MAG: flagellin [Aquificae bacterium]|nr:flagellin [Aquificota bacterium]
MALRINYNYQAEFGHVNILKTERNLNTSLERLETGYRINSAKDDAAGLFIADQLNLVASALDQGVRNAQDGISAAQIAETTLAQIYDKLVSIYTKAEQAANDTNSALNRDALQEDIDKLIDAIDRIAKSSEFNGKKLLDGSFKSQYIHYGPRADQKLSISIDSATAEDLAAYTIKGNGKATGDGGKDLATLIDGTDYEFDSATDKVVIQGVDLTTAIKNSVGDGSLTDASVIAKHINGDPDLKMKDITASATNTSVAGAEFGVHNTGNDTLTIKIYVGPETDEADITLNFDKNTTITGDVLVDLINSNADNLPIEASLDEAGRVVLTTENGETIAVEVTVGANGNEFDLNKLINLGAETKVSAGSTGSAVKVGDLHVFGSNAYGYDFTGLSTTDTGLGVNATDSSSKTSLETIKVDTNANAEYSLKVIDNIIKKVDRMRANLGSIQINLETIIQNNEFSAVQQREAESRIRNVDFAKEMANFTRYQTLMQSGMAMMAQANQLPQMVLQLLR